MKHLKRFNESSDLYNTIISDCKDILLDLTDVGIRCSVDMGIKWDGVKSQINVDKVKIEIEASERSKVRLGDFGSSFEHLLSYLESKGYILDNKGSFYENDDWDSYEECPECRSTNVSYDRFTNGERNWGSDYKCGKCGHVGDVDNFQSQSHPISKSELLNSIRNNYYIDFMYLVFLKKTS
jgi:predicted Zn-ribbon and HTH transcriptional regulator